MPLVLRNESESITLTIYVKEIMRRLKARHNNIPLSENPPFSLYRGIETEEIQIVFRCDSIQFTDLSKLIGYVEVQSSTYPEIESSNDYNNGWKLYPGWLTSGGKAWYTLEIGQYVRKKGYVDRFDVTITLLRNYFKDHT